MKPASFTLLFLFTAMAVASASPLKLAYQEEPEDSFSEEAPADKELCERALIIKETPLLMPIAKQEAIEITDFEPTKLKSSFSRKERKLIQQMREDTLFENWDEIPSNVPFKTSNGFLVTKVYDDNLGLPSFIFDGKKYIVTEPSIAGKNRLSYRASPPRVEPRSQKATKSQSNLAPLLNRVKNKFSKKVVIPVLTFGLIASGGYFGYDHFVLAPERALREQFPSPESLEPEVQKTIKLAKTTHTDVLGDNPKKNEILLSFTEKHLDRLSVEQILILAEHTHTDALGDNSAKNPMLLKYVEQNRLKLSYEQIIEIVNNTHTDALGDNSAKDKILELAR